MDAATLETAGGGLAFTDSRCSFRVYAKRAIEAPQTHGNGLSSDSEILIKASEHLFNLLSRSLHSFNYYWRKSHESEDFCHYPGKK